MTSDNTDVGGTNAIALVNLTSHGSRTTDSRVTINGLSTQNAEGAGNSSGVLPNISGTQEFSVDFAAGSAEMANGGVGINVIPRDGGNTFRGTFFANGTHEAWQSSNFTDDLKAGGLLTANTMKIQYDVNPGFGGPIIRDRLWFFSSARWNGNQNYVGGVFWNKFAYNPNVGSTSRTRPARASSAPASAASAATSPGSRTRRTSSTSSISIPLPVHTAERQRVARSRRRHRYPYRPSAGGLVLAMTSRSCSKRVSYRPERWFYPLHPQATSPR